MARPRRPLLSHGCYHLIARGNNRQFLFTDIEAFRYFLDLLARARNSGEFGKGRKIGAVLNSVTSAPNGASATSTP